MRSARASHSVKRRLKETGMKINLFETSRITTRESRLTTLALLAATALSIGAAAEASAAVFQGLGFLPSGTNSFTYGLSADGTTVVGSGDSTLGADGEAYRWTQAGGMTGLGLLPSGAVSVAYGVSADGSVVVGSSYDFIPVPYYYEGFRWTQAGGMTGLGALPSGTISEANGVSADGTAVAGSGDSTAVSGGFEAIRWTQAGGMIGLGALPSGTYSFGQGISADGTTVVGYGDSALSPLYEAFRWTQAGGMTGLGLLGGTESYAYRVSAGGSVVVGDAKNASGEFQAFRWTQAGGMVGLGDLPGGAFDSHGDAVSADGSIVVGRGMTALGQAAFIWDAVNGMRNLRDVLAGYGVNTNGWTLTDARSVKGTAIGGELFGLGLVGWGMNPLGATEAWEFHVMPALVLQFDSVNYAAGTWTDTSGNANNATQSTGGLRPTLVWSATPGGKPALQFDGADDFLSLTTALSSPAFTTSPNLTFVTVVKNYKADTSGGTFTSTFIGNWGAASLSMNSGSGVGGVVPGQGRIYLSTPGIGGGGYSDFVAKNQWMIYAGTYDGSAGKFYTNGVQVTTGFFSALAPPNPVTTIGGFASPGGFLEGQMAALYVYDAALGGAAVGTISSQLYETYFVAKRGTVILIK